MSNNNDVRENAIVVAQNRWMVSEKGDVRPEINCNIFPNPVTDILHITGLEGHYTIKMVDAVGQVVASIKGTSAKLEFDMSSKPAGMYLIKIESQGKSITRKLIKK